MLTSLAVLALLPREATATFHGSDGQPVVDPLRPVTQITRDSFTLHYFTAEPCPTKVEFRQSDLPRSAYGPRRKEEFGQVLTASQPNRRQFHRITLSGLQPGKRYYYRIWDPGAKPTAREKSWGAADGYRREYAASTLAPKGQKTIIHLPVKVLLMPNVVNAESAFADPGNPAPPPPAFTPADLQKIKDEYAVSARFLWVASGMRLWVDHQFFVDERWQRWGPEPAQAQGFFKGLPVSRSYQGQDYAAPGGGDFTILDTKDPQRVTKEPVVEALPYSAQIEQAFPRRWNPKTGKWEFYTSGGGTYGIDEYPRGVPGRSQYLGGSDTAWLATHELHHNLESHGTFSLSDREDERIVFNHPTPRRRVVRPDGSVDEVAWSTSGRHGEHWDVMAWWDRQLTDAQWLRMFFGRTITVKDADQDGLPDDDPRLPLDERRFGSSSRKAATDGNLNDLHKAMLSNWAPGPIQSSWIKPPFQAVLPSPTSPDSDRDGLLDTQDPYPLYLNVPLIAPLTPKLDGDASEWRDIPAAAQFQKGGIDFTFKQAHDEDGYYGLYEISGPWKRITASFDGEGKGVYSGEGVLGFETILNDAESPDLISTRPTFGAPGLTLKAQRSANGVTVEFRLPNRGDGPWFWHRGGNEIGAMINVWDTEGRGFSAWEPYRPFYARMVEAHGQAPMPADVPAELVPGPGVRVYRPEELKAEAGWTVQGGRASYPGGDEAALYLDGLKAGDFDFMAVVEGKNDGILGAFTSSTKQMSSGEGIIGFVGGYGNTVTRMRVYGTEAGDDQTAMTPGKHRIQLSRRNGGLWLMVDGKPVVYTRDPNPKAVIDRLAIIGGYNGNQIVHEVRVRF
jgi:hypothetical protein